MKHDRRGCREDQPAVYRIRVGGRIDRRWSDWFCGMDVRYEASDDRGAQTLLTGLVPDQAALRGLLGRIWNLNLTVISVAQVENGRESG